MTDDPDTAREETSLTTFTTNGYVIVGAGETIDEIQVNGRWLKTDSPVEVRR